MIKVIDIKNNKRYYFDVIINNCNVGNNIKLDCNNDVVEGTICSIKHIVKSDNGVLRENYTEITVY